MMRPFAEIAAGAHRWDLSPAAAADVQRQLARQVIRRTVLDRVDTVAGVDTAYRDGIARAAAVVLRLPDLTPVDAAVAQCAVDFPYIPGLLAFREGPAVMAALQRLTSRPDLLIFDAQGIAHPRRCGMASHIGVLVNTPAIGCAKTVLTGRYDAPGSRRGSFTLLRAEEDVVGAAVRTRTDVAPVFVSIGHRVDLDDCIRFTLACCRGYRLPETSRRADRLAAFPRRHS